MDAKIDKEEMELEMKEIESKFNENVALFKKYHNRTKEKETIVNLFNKLSLNFMKILLLKLLDMLHNF